jgi:hypothetical protein
MTNPNQQGKRSDPLTRDAHDLSGEDLFLHYLIFLINVQTSHNCTIFGNQHQKDNNATVPQVTDAGNLFFACVILFNPG